MAQAVWVFIDLFSTLHHFRRTQAEPFTAFERASQSLQTFFFLFFTDTTFESVQRVPFAASKATSIRCCVGFILCLFKSKQVLFRCVCLLR